MADTWIVDMSLFDFPDDEADEVPGEARRLAEYFASIVEATLRGASPIDGSIDVRCRRRPGRRRCTGIIQSELDPNRNELCRQCPVCGDNGRISNWKGTRWDPSKGHSRSAVTFETDSIGMVLDKEYMSFKGTIEWDESIEGALPKIVTARKAYRWIELGRALMAFDGFQINIKIS